MNKSINKILEESLAKMVAVEVGKLLLEAVFLIPYEEICDEVTEQLEMDIEGKGFNSEHYIIKEDKHNAENC